MEVNQMARGNSKGVLIKRKTLDAVRLMNGEPFAVSDIMLAFRSFTNRSPSKNEVGAALRYHVRCGNIIRLGQTVSNKSREMLEAAGLVQGGSPKATLYIEKRPESEEE